MNITKVKKILQVGSMSASIFAMGLFAPLASAHSDNAPRLYSIRERTENSVLLPIRDTKFKNKTTTAIVSIKEKSTKNIVERSVSVSLNKRGNASIMIDKLKSKTRYVFKVRLMKIGKEKTTKNSDSKSAKTL